MHDYEVVVTDNKLNFRKANKTDGAPTVLTWQDNMISFRPRMSGVQQPQTVNIRAWDPKNKQAVTGHRQQPADDVDRPASSARRCPTTSAAARPRSPTASRPTTARPTSSPRPRCSGWPTRSSRPTAPPSATRRSRPAARSRSRASAQKFSGTYTVTSSTHTYRGTTGYQTSFQISGRSSRTLLELMRPPQERDWSATLVVGVVTNNNDPDQMGRVRVKYPSLSDSEESAWARIATPERGQRARPADAPAAQRGGHRRLRARRHPPADRRRLGLQRRATSRARI